MLKLSKITHCIFFAANLLVIAAMALCALTSYLPPQKYPNWSYLGLMFPVFLALNVAFVVFWLVTWRKTLWLPLAGVLVCGGAVRAYLPINFGKEAPEGSIKVLSYNVMGFNKKDYPEMKDNPIVNYILDSDADIVCLQETRAATDNSVWDSMKKKYEHVETFTFNHNHISVLSHYPVVAVENIEYPAATNCSVAFHLKMGEDTIVVINNHFESYKLDDKDKENYKSIIRHPKDESTDERYVSLTDKLAAANALRGVQTDSVFAYIARHEGKHIICCGDFNDAPVSYTHQKLTRKLNDAYTRSGNGPGISYNRSGMLFRIDNILVSEEMDPYGAVVDTYGKASDHYPIYCYLKIGKK